MTAAPRESAQNVGASTALGKLDSRRLKIESQITRAVQRLIAALELELDQSLTLSIIDAIDPI